MERRRSSSKSPEIPHSSKKISEETSKRMKSGKGEASKRTDSSEKTSTDLLTLVDKNITKQFLVSAGETQRLKSTQEKEKSKPSSSKLEKQHSLKNEETSKRKESSKEKILKRTNSSEKTSSDKSVLVDKNKSKQSFTYPGENRKKESIQDTEKSKPLSSKLEKQHSSKNEETSKRKESRKEKILKRTNSSEKTSTYLLALVDKHITKQSWASAGETQRLESTEEKSKPSSSKLGKQHSSKKNEETSKRTGSSKEKFLKRTNSSEETSSDKSVFVDKNKSKKSFYSPGENRKKESIQETKKSTLLSSKLEKQHSSKKNEGTSKRAGSSKEKFSKRPNSNDRTSTDKSVLVDRDHCKQFSSSAEENIKVGSVKSEKEKCKPSSSKQKERQHSWKKSKKTLKRTKSSREYSKRTISREVTSSDENFYEYEIKNTRTVDSDNKQKVESLHILRKSIKRTSFPDLSDKLHSLKKNEVTRKQTDTNKGKRTHSSEDTSEESLFVDLDQLPEKQCSSKGNAENLKRTDTNKEKASKRTDTNKEKASKRTHLGEDTSEESLFVDIHQLPKKQWSSKENEENSKRTDTNEEKTSKRAHSSEDTSSEEVLIIDVSEVNNSLASKRGKIRNVERMKFGHQRIRPLSSRLPEKKPPSKKKLVETLRRTNSSKEEACKKPSEERLSTEFGCAKFSRALLDHNYSLAPSEENSLKGPTRTERKKSISSRSPGNHFTKKNVEETTQRNRWSDDRNTNKRMNYCDESSPDELENDMPQVQLDGPHYGMVQLGSRSFYDARNRSESQPRCSWVQNDRNFSNGIMENRKNSTELGDDTGAPNATFEPITHSESEMEHHDTEVENSAWASNALNPVNKDNVKQELENNRSLIKQDIKKESKGFISDNDGPRSSSINDWWERRAKFSRALQDHKYSLAPSEENSLKAPTRRTERKESIFSRSPGNHFTKKNVEEAIQRNRWSDDRNTNKRLNFFNESSPDELENDMPQVQLNDPITDGNRRSKEVPSSQTALTSEYKNGNACNKVSDSADSFSEGLQLDAIKIDTKDAPTVDNVLKEQTNSEMSTGRPNIYEPSKTSPFSFWGKNAVVRQNLKDEDGRTRKVKTISEAIADIEFKKCKPLMLQDNNKETSQSRNSNVEQGSPSFHNAGNRSESEAGCSWFQNDRNLSNGIMENRENGTELEDNTGAQNATFEPIAHSEGKMEHQKYDTEVENGAWASNAPNSVNKDNVKGESENNRSLIKQDFKKESKGFISDNAGSQSSSMSDWWEKGISKSRKPKIPITADIENKKEGADVKDGLFKSKAPHIVRVFKKRETKELKGFEGESEDSDKTKIDDAEPGSSLHDQRKGDFKPVKTTGHSDNYMEHGKGATNTQDGACSRGSPKLIKSDNAKKSSKNWKSPKTLGKKDLNRSKSDDAEDACEGSNENIPDLSISPGNNGIPKRQSDQSDPLKEIKNPDNTSF